VAAGLRTVRVTRYVTPLREGGSMPALVEADDDGAYVLKFRGAGQGPGALVAEVLCGELGRALGLPVPELVLAELDPALAVAEPDPEVQDLLRASAGLNVGVDFLPGALPFAGGADPALAADVVWFDALVLNVDRTPRNPNLLLWHGRMWCIDHGAALYPQHGEAFAAAARKPLPGLADHVLLADAEPLARADGRLAERARAAVPAAVAAVPEDWLPHAREVYERFLLDRLDAPREEWLGG
jgi:hypothetical protein